MKFVLRPSTLEALYKKGIRTVTIAPDTGGSLVVSIVKDQSERFLVEVQETAGSGFKVGTVVPVRKTAIAFPAFVNLTDGGKMTSEGCPIIGAPLSTSDYDIWEDAGSVTEWYNFNQKRKEVSPKHKAHFNDEVINNFSDYFIPVFPKQFEEKKHSFQRVLVAKNITLFAKVTLD